MRFFSNDISKATGLDPRVVYAWADIEGANAPGGTGGFNFLNLRPQAGDPYASVSSGGFEQFASLANAETATVRRIKEPFASPILASVSPTATPASEISAIASTGWDAGHYGGVGGPNLQAEFAALFGKSQLRSSTSGSPIATSGGQGVSPSTATGSITGDILNATGLGAIGAFFGWFTSGKNLTRIAEVIGGAILVLIGILAIIRGTTVVSAAGSVARVAR